LEEVAAGFSRTPDLRKKRKWTIANVGLYIASLVALGACFVVPRGDDRGPRCFILFPDVVILFATIGAFFTLSEHSSPDSRSETERGDDFISLEYKAEGFA
jgi:hypothetical protein